MRVLSTRAAAPWLTSSLVLWATACDADAEPSTSSPAAPGWGSSSSSGDAPTGGPGSSSGTAHPTECGDLEAPEVPEVRGRFALFEVAAQLVSVPGFAEPVSTRFINTLLVDQTQEGTAISLQARYCDQRSEDPDLIVHLVVPDAFTASLPAFTRTGTYMKEDGRYRYRLPPTYHVEGAVLTDVAGETLPTDASDPRVFDQDGDGKPGMTMRLTGFVDGDIYLVSRGVTSMEGGPIDREAIEGSMTATTEQVILGSDPPLLKDFAATTTSDETPCLSRFRMVRVPDDADCAYVTSNFDTLFR